MKKILTALLILALALSACACTKNENTEENENVNETADENTDAFGDNEVDVAEVEENAGAAQDEAVEAMTYEEYAAAETDSPVVIEAYVQAKQSWWEDKATLYLQDEDGAYFVYNAECSEKNYEKLVPGTKVRVVGYKSEWSGEIEITDAKFTFVEGGDTFIAEPMDVTELLDKEELIDYQNRFVSFKNMTVESAGKDEAGNDVAFLYRYDGSGNDGDDLYFNVSSNGKTYQFSVESYLCDNTTDVYSAVKALSVGDVIDMEGFLYWYEGVNPHITSVTPVIVSTPAAE